MERKGSDQKNRSQRKKNILHLILSFWKKMSADKINVYAAQAAYYLVMSIAPIMMLVLLLLKFTPITEEVVLDTLAMILNEDVMVTVKRVVNGLYHGSVTFASFVMLSLLYVSGSGVMGLTNGLNNIYHLKENRNYPMLRLRSSVYTLLIVVSIIFSFGMLSMGLRFRDLFSSTHPLFMMVQNRVLHYGMILLALVLLTLLFCMLYVLLPNRKKRFRTQLYGAVFTTVSWLIFAEIFRFYLTYAKNLSIIYGGLMTIAVVMLSLYICMYLFFFGAEINAYMENPDSFPF